MLRIVKIISIFLAGSLLGGAVMAWAFNNPTQAPPDGSGILVVSNSNVGIGVSPSNNAKLHVGASGTTDPFLVQTNNGTSLIVKNTTGNVGINKADPAFKLDVDGDTNISGKLTVGQLCFSGVCSTSWAAVPGMISMFDGACPSGWTRFSALDGRFPLGGNSYGVTGGASSINSIDSGNANYDATGASPQSGVNVVGWAHQHPAVQAPPYLTVVWCKKNL